MVKEIRIKIFKNLPRCLLHNYCIDTTEGKILNNNNYIYNIYIYNLKINK